jgi:hypothetical protein
MAALTAASPARGKTAIPVDVSFFDDARKLQLAGHLSQPDGSGPSPAVVMLSSTGQGSRRSSRPLSLRVSLQHHSHGRNLGNGDTKVRRT